MHQILVWSFIIKNFHTNSLYFTNSRKLNLAYCNINHSLVPLYDLYDIYSKTEHLSRQTMKCDRINSLFCIYVIILMQSIHN